VLLAVVIIFLGRPHAKRLLLFFLAGALLASVSIGLAAVSILDAADMGSSTRRSFGGGVYFTIGVAALVAGLHFLRTAPRPKKQKESGGPSMTQRVLTKDSTWLVFVLGIVLNMPGLWYIMGLKNIGLGNYSEAAAVLLVLGFNVIMFSFIEIPLIGYLVAPRWTQSQITRFNGWLHRNGRHLGGWIGVALGCYLIARGIAVVV
jgi:Sap, sulfolipid-1-addressing protein